VAVGNVRATKGDFDDVKEEEEETGRLNETIISMDELHTIFSSFDPTDNGIIPFSSLRSMLSQVNIHLGEEEEQDLFDQLGVEDGDVMGFNLGDWLEMVDIFSLN